MARIPRRSRPNGVYAPMKYGLILKSHSTCAIAFDLYQHVITTMKEAHANAVDNILKREPQTA